MRQEELSHGIIRDLLLQNNPDFEVVFVRHAGRVLKLTFMVMIMEFEKLVCTNYWCSLRVRNTFNGITVQVST